VIPITIACPTRSSSGDSVPRSSVSTTTPMWKSRTVPLATVTPVCPPDADPDVGS
jgi:hypothetical protein